MMFMNQYEINQAYHQHRNHPVLRKATALLVSHCEETNAHSDGWAYWKAPLKASAKLMSLVQSGNATEAQLRAAVAPIKAFYTRKGIAAGMRFPSETLE